MYFDRLLPPELGVAAVRVRGGLDVAVAGAALAQVGQRHDALRARVRTDGTTVEQHIQPTVGRDLLTVRPADSLADVQTERRAAGDPPDLAADGPLQARWHPTAGDDGVLVLEISHPWADAWSLELVLRDFWEAYGRVATGAAPLKRAGHSWATRLAAQAALAEPPAAAKQVEVWGHPLRALAPARGAPPAGPTDPGTAELVVDAWDPQLLAQARRLAASNRATIPMVAFAACGLALSRVLGRPEVGLLSSMMTRSVAGERVDEVGFCQSLAPATMPVEVDATVGQLITGARRQVTQLLINARPPYSFTSMLRALAARGIEPAAPLLQRWRTGQPGRSPFVPYFNPIRYAGRRAASETQRGLGLGLRVERIDLLPSYSPCNVFDLMYAPRLDTDQPELRIYYTPSSISRDAVLEMAALSRAFLASDPATPSALVSPASSPAT
jgi:hypothetical protein